jgi:hypothetical protein
MADRALVFPTERDEVDAFIVDHHMYDGIECADLCGVWFWDTEDAETFRLWITSTYGSQVLTLLKASNEDKVGARRQ